MSTGLYLSVPFCRTKCTYCNFASDVFSRAVFDRYLNRVCHDLHTMPETARDLGGQVSRGLDSIYFGGGTPTVLESQQLRGLLRAIGENYKLSPGTEITVECAPGTLAPAMLDVLLDYGVNRISLGVQSFVDREAAAVGRLHTRLRVLEDVARLRAAGIGNINLDLIAGLPYQTTESWLESLEVAMDLGVPHISVYMLEVDAQSRLGRERIAGGTRYHARFVPDDDLTADLYLRASERFEAAGILPYEISNFATPGFESRHNLKYWTRQPYLGFGVDAHSMLPAGEDGIESIRFSTADSLESFLAGAPLRRTVVSRQGALEESYFLGLRLTRGVDLQELAAKFGSDQVDAFRQGIAECVREGLLEQEASVLRLTPRGRLLSNEVFQQFLSVPGGAAPTRETVRSVGEPQGIPRKPAPEGVFRDYSCFPLR
ncbi:MAG TPA: radical SAM family heme chaperone HemW [Terriglobales bacterium]|nr:radical SAM family heme chaperone HemW [Terriglobales bacterium]